MRGILALALGLSLLLPGLAGAQEVGFKVRVILARQVDGPPDGKIPRKLQSYLERSFGARFKSFKLLVDKGLSVEKGETGTLKLMDASELRLTFREIQGDFVVLQLELKDLDATVRIRDGGMFFQAGHRYGDGMLVLAVTARLKDSEKDDEKLENPRPIPREGDSAAPGNPRRDRRKSE